MCRAEIFLRRRPRHLRVARWVYANKMFRNNPRRRCRNGVLTNLQCPYSGTHSENFQLWAFRKFNFIFPENKMIHRFCLETRKSAKAQGCSNAALFRKYGLGGKSAGLPEKLRDVSPLLSGRIFVLFFGREIFYHHQVPHRC